MPRPNRDEASMRPRVFPAEDANSICYLNGKQIASMRPRVFPAEDGHSPSASAGSASSFNEAAGIPRGRRIDFLLKQHAREASMRPRVFPAEDRLDARDGGPRRPASMRPRVFPAEDPFCRRGRRSVVRGFNEAAGIPRGRRAWHGSSRRHPARFNEAAGIPRGRRRWLSSCGQTATSFNEAAGIPRGRLPKRLQARVQFRIASMRPRVFPAEDTDGRPAAGRRVDASMRPRVFPAEDLNEAASPPSVNEKASMRPRVFPAEDPPGAQSRYGPNRRFNEAAGIPRGRHFRQAPHARSML